MAHEHRFGVKTLLVHGDLSKKAGQNKIIHHPHEEPIYKTTAWKFESTNHGLALFSGQDLEHDFYSRVSNPNHRFLEELVAILENAEKAQSFCSGTAALVALKDSLLEAGDEVIAHRNLYGGTYKQLKNWENFGIRTKFVNASNHLKILENITPRTKWILGEFPSNPNLDLFDYELVKSELKAMGREDILVFVDNTFSSPFNHKPLLHGADVVWESGTKFLNGYGDSLWGVFASSKTLHDRVWKRYDGFACLDPLIAFYISINIKSLFDRMKDHNENAIRVAGFLKAHPRVKRVYYPGLDDHPNHALAKRLMITPDGSNGYGGMVSFELKTLECVKKFQDQLGKDEIEGRGIISLSVSLGTVDTLICCPALSTHSQVSEEGLNEQGIPKTLIRMSVGKENVEDIIYSLERGFSAI